MKNTNNMIQLFTVLICSLLFLACESSSGSQLGTGSGVVKNNNQAIGITIELFEDAYRFSNDSFASSCLEYKNSDSYNEQGDALYWIFPTIAVEAFKVLCDKTTDGGGWTLIDNVAASGEYFTGREAGANTDLSTTRGAILPAFDWGLEPKLLCRSSHFTGSTNWLTFNLLTEQAKSYPVSSDVGLTNSSGHFSLLELNGNTNQGTNAWIYNTAGRIGTIWIGNGSQPTCACNYTATAHTGLGGRVSRAATCSTWVK